ncbi:hypothetical protein Xcel_0498 [Xylanimonas cellulosilytica DSM 15894]|uniref:Lipoprotein LpqN n=1 Tax=Xylanimonas cellulosilytica (strain DSM 15894 / JCM 12276 / CECT 5975 / KCTC 9989 / LMG 20990 / NBRC 107835 / XIL07) TaxID=446471 RepID=D1BW34_XYLCX|nr:LpqN/LpqT family lipoprotein [Xylanimonas cellulosilytica]ACZ29537.1 hypothetical protein Xcel_0498 [Xylanimonas cellulosilytica DSM 15894]
MPTVSYPSAQFPGFPSVEVPRPDGWSPLAAPQVLLAVARDGAPGEFRANVVVTVTRLDADQTLGTVAKAAAAALESRRDYAERRRDGIGISGLPGYVVQGAWVSADAGTVAQDVRGVIVEHDGVRDLVEITATCGGGQVDPAWAELQTILDGIVIGVAR